MAQAEDPFDRAGRDHLFAALVLLLEETAPGEFNGIAGAAVYTGSPALEGPQVETEVKSRNGAQRYKTVAVPVTAEEARAFVAALYSGKTKIPGTDYICTFALRGCESGFTATEANGWNDTGESEMLLSRPHWTRRHRATTKRVNGHDLSVETVNDIVAALPDALPLRFRPLNLEHRLEAIGDFLELLEPAVEFATIESDDQIHYELKVCLGSDQLPFRLFVRSFHSHMLVSSQVFAVQPGSGTIPLDGEFGRIDYDLTRDGILVGAHSGAFIRTAGLQVGISPGSVSIELDRSGLGPIDVAIAPTSYAHVTAGKTQPPSLMNNQAVRAAMAWRASLASTSAFSERVFTAPAALSRREGLQYLADLVASAVAAESTKDIYLVDQYGINIAALLRVAAAAAKVSGGTVHLLTRNLPPPGAQGQPAAAYEEFARRVAQRLGVTIKRYVPSRDVHDRYIWIGTRFWHVGHSLNELGSDVSAIIEIRSIREQARLRDVLLTEFAQGPADVYQ